MLASTAKISVPNRRPAVNSKPATDIEPSRRRCQARLAVVCDTALSPGSRLLYVLLDDHGRLEGNCYPSHAKLAEELGVSRRTVIDWLEELASSGYIRSVRRQRSSLYFLRWADVQPPAQQAAPVLCSPQAPDVQPVAQPYMVLSEAGETGAPLPELEPEPEPACPTCRDTGWSESLRQLCECSEGQAIRKRLWAPKCRV